MGRRGVADIIAHAGPPEQTTGADPTKIHGEAGAGSALASASAITL